MKLLLSGPIEGHLTSFYSIAEKFNPHWVVCAGDYGIWPDPQRRDRAAKKHGSVDFSRLYVGVNSYEIKTPTLTVAGVHDDNRWLNHRQIINNAEILNNVHWLAQGFKTIIGWDGVPIRVTGLGRAYSESTYSGIETKKSYRHYTRKDVERACSSGPTDLLVVYDHIDAPGISNIVYATRPKLILNVKHPNRKDYDNVQNIPLIQLPRGTSKLVEWDNKRFVL